MDSLLDKQTEIRNMLDVRSNIVIGFDSALIIVFVTTFHDTLMTNWIGWIVLGTLLASLLCAIIALKPPHCQSKKGQKESLFYHHYIESKTLQEYKAEIHGVLKNKNQIFDAYIQEIYNLTNYSNIPRKLYLYLSIRILLYGLIVSVLAYGLTVFWSMFII